MDIESAMDRQEKESHVKGAEERAEVAQSKAEDLRLAKSLLEVLAQDIGNVDKMLGVIGITPTPSNPGEARGEALAKLQRSMEAIEEAAKSQDGHAAAAQENADYTSSN